MSNGVKVKYSELDPMKTELDNIIDEFDRAGARRNELKDAVGKPYGKSDLHDAADDFEGRWDDRRKKLMGNCEAVRDHVKTVIEGFKDFDAESAIQFDQPSSTGGAS